MRATLASCFLLTSLAAGEAHASDRQFAYTYNTATLPAGEMELEPWTTFRVGRDNFYFRMDQRLEFEVGFTDAIQGALYLKFHNTTSDAQVAGVTERTSEFEFDGISAEFKGKLSDSVADPLGVALYLEPGIGPTSAQLEAKVLLDKRAGDFYFAYNLVGEYEPEFEDVGELKHELALEHYLGLGGYLSEAVFLGVEVRNVNLFEVGEGFESSTFFGGPAVSFRQKGFWAAFSFTPQLGSIKAEEEGETAAGGEEEGSSPFDLTHHERITSRLILGFDL